MKITMAHGSGGASTSQLMNDIFSKHFSNEVLDKMEDAAKLKSHSEIAFTTDSYVVDPIFFMGGDIGKLAVCGTVNDLLVMGATPKYLTAGFILEEGLDFVDLEKIVKSMKIAAKRANIKIVAGDTKVIEGKGGIYINTSGIGFLENSKDISASNCKKGDSIILSGTLGEHHACILSARMNIVNNIKSDCAPLNSIVVPLLESGIEIKCMRDVTRGGLATVLNEISASSKHKIIIDEKRIPISKEVKGFCEILGLDPHYMANEGKIIIVVPKVNEVQALNIVQNTVLGKNSVVIGAIAAKGKNVYISTKFAGERKLDILFGEGLPRIC